MGGCPSKCEVKCGNGFRYEGSTLELNFEQQPNILRNKDRNRSASSSRQGESATLPATNFRRELEYSDNILQTQSDPKNELISSNIEVELLPIFVTKKQINESTVSNRQNKFMEDLEIEVKARIQEIKQQEQEEIQRLIIKEIVKQQLEFEQFKSEQISNSQTNQQQENSFQFNQKQQLSPKKNTSKESKDSQFASFQSSSLQLSSEKQSNIQSSINKTDPLKYSTNNPHQIKAYEKLISNYYLEDTSNYSKHKGILKQRNQIQFPHTSKSLPNKRLAKSKLFKKKRVHFSQDTNFNFEKKGEEKKSSKTWWKSLF
ncbi:unnamed protein product [Paramecium pentaurelia]|uniref:Uncharacterized protein n=1 Tax=Paramecium pentaurelia TaxID=43138 RepID=A0A8S1SBR3_9CILI|nr:unnamed protein product [Paramecium pentaurelia]